MFHRGSERHASISKLHNVRLRGCPVVRQVLGLASLIELHVARQAGVSEPFVQVRGAVRDRRPRRPAAKMCAECKRGRPQAGDAIPQCQARHSRIQQRQRMTSIRGHPVYDELTSVPQGRRPATRPIY